ncbi:hypothetical protein Y1Q_0011478 [Alligator mississippiensis]|uniref:Homeobox domain-containing protein n=1 Tax=Alligator mississippiensis TaxID=8496 RepID=A0A151LZY1_ALLMI|nr:hypothetical protein Y1Q_0011478 [Alligator mississippiensis]
MEIFLLSVPPSMGKAHSLTQWKDGYMNPNYNGGEPKRSRTAYTRQQVLELEKEFHFNRNPKILQKELKSKFKKKHKSGGSRGSERPAPDT